MTKVDKQLRDLGEQVDEALDAADELETVAIRLGMFRQALIHSGFSTTSAQTLARDYFNEILNRTNE